MDSLEGGDRLATGLELSHLVLDHRFNSQDKMDGSGEWRDILDSEGVVITVNHCDFGVSQPEQNVTELNLLWVLTSLAPGA